MRSKIIGATITLAVMAVVAFIGLTTSPAQCHGNCPSYQCTATSNSCITCACAIPHGQVFGRCY